MLCVLILILFLYNKYKDKSEDTQHCWVGIFPNFQISEKEVLFHERSFDRSNRKNPLLYHLLVFVYIFHD